MYLWNFNAIFKEMTTNTILLMAFVWRSYFGQQEEKHFQNFRGIFHTMLLCTGVSYLWHKNLEDFRKGSFFAYWIFAYIRKQFVKTEIDQ